MKSQPHVSVQNPPVRYPLMIYDGDCGFCQFSVQRIQRQVDGYVQFEPSQTAAERFPEVAGEEFQGAVQLIEPSGAVYRAAEAVFRTYWLAGRRRVLYWAYRTLPGFAWLCETIYAWVARNRGLVTKILEKLGFDVSSGCVIQSGSDENHSQR